MELVLTRPAPHPAKPWQDRVVVVTGAASGIGRAICRIVQERGARVVATDIDEQGLSTLSNMETRVLDVTREADFRDAIAEVVGRHGAVDYLFNNAGISVCGEARDLDPAHWRRVMDVTLNGVLHGVAAAYPLMARQRWGHIVNTASLAGLLPAPTMAPYATAKHAVVGLSQTLRAEGRALGVRVTALCPAYIESGIYEASECVKVKPGSVRRFIRPPIAPTEPAVRALLRGVERNEALVVYPRYARVLWGLYRLWPGLLEPLARDTLKTVRAARQD